MKLSLLPELEKEVMVSYHGERKNIFQNEDHTVEMGDVEEILSCKQRLTRQHS